MRRNELTEARRGLFLVALLLSKAALHATTYYVATTGSDSNSGASNAPFATPQKAVTLSALTAGDTIYVRGGTYALNTQVKPSKVGTATDYIKLWAYPGELPVFDFASMSAINKALDLRKDYWHVKGIEVKNCTTESGIFIGGFGAIIEGCVVHDCNNDGFILGSTSVKATNALILNCDSYRNFQASSGGNNGDGFAAKAGCATGNVFRGCRAWNNADDGWDFYDNNNSVALQSCWAFSNGYDLWNVGSGFSGNGNGFKLGGEGTTAEHHLTNCVAFGNKSKGFDHNNGNAGQTMVNCTSYNNATDFSFYETPTAGTLLHNVLLNCVAFAGTLTNLAANSVMISNSWQGFTVTAADFASLNTSVATNSRNADCSLPSSSLFRLAAGSDLIDAGANVGLLFSGSAPDLGAFEFQPSAAAALPVIDAAGSGWTNGGFHVRVTGLAGLGPAILHASTNLSTWSPLSTNAAAADTGDFLDATTEGQGIRLYRVEEKRP